MHNFSALEQSLVNVNIGIVINEDSSALVYSTSSNLAALYLSLTVYLTVVGWPALAMIPLGLASSIFPSQLTFLVPGLMLSALLTGKKFQSCIYMFANFIVVQTAISVSLGGNLA